VTPLQAWEGTKQAAETGKERAAAGMTGGTTGGAMGGPAGTTGGTHASSETYQRESRTGGI